MLHLLISPVLMHFCVSVCSLTHAGGTAPLSQGNGSQMLLEECLVQGHCCTVRKCTTRGGDRVLTLLLVIQKLIWRNVTLSTTLSARCWGWSALQGCCLTHTLIQAKLICAPVISVLRWAEGCISSPKFTLPLHIWLEKECLGEWVSHNTRHKILKEVSNVKSEEQALERV